MTAALELDRVSKNYASHQAVRDISLAVPAGTIYGILGPNGAGKSTTLRMVMSIIARDTGTIAVLGQPPERRGVLRRVGYLPEERGLYRRMSVLDVIVFFARLKGMTGSAARRDAVVWLERMGLGEWQRARVDTLSKGMQQKVQFIATVLHAPELLILDEPHSGLDPVNQEVLRETMLSIRDAGGTVVLSTHNMDQAEALCEAVCIIAGGEKVLDGAVRDIRRAHRGSHFRLRLDRPHADTVADVHALLARLSASVSRSDDGATWDFELRDGRAPEVLAGLGVLHADVERFERVEPSLHEIFIERVGTSARRADRRE